MDSEREQASKRPQKRPSDGQINGVDLSNNPQVVELQRESTRQISEYKLKVQKAELDIAALESSVSQHILFLMRSGWGGQRLCSLDERVVYRLIC